MKSKSITTPCLAHVIFLLMTIYLPVHGQTLAGRYSMRLEPTETEKLLANLSNADSFKSTIKTFFDLTFDDNLADLVFFIDERIPQKNTVTIQLIHKKKQRDFLSGEQFLYVTAFIATPKRPDTNSILYPPPKSNGKYSDSRKCKCDSSDTSKTQTQISGRDNTHKIDSLKSLIKDSLSVHMSVLGQSVNTGEFAVYSILQTVASSICKYISIGTIPPDSLKGLSNNEKVIRLGDTGNTVLYFVFSKIPLKLNTINRVRLGEFGEKWLYQANVVNYSSARITSSIGILKHIRINHHQHPKDSLQVHSDISPFLFVHWYVFSSPHLPPPAGKSEYDHFWKKRSYSVVAGTNLTGTIGDDLFIGLCLGHLVSKISFLAGFDYRLMTYNNGDHDWKNREFYLSTGLSYIF
jgi:hypothetical protein